MKRIGIITAVPWNVRGGSGCYVGTSTLIEAIQQLGISVGLVTPAASLPTYTATRVWFNESLRRRRFDYDVTIGIDVDGYSIAGRPGAPPHIACIKGVLGDAVCYESGVTRLSLALQARLEAAHARRASLVITVSRYCAKRLGELYGVKHAVVVPELIDLDAWRRKFLARPDAPDPRKFTVLSVCRFYPRKRLEVLLRAAALLRDRIPGLQVRIVGNGPERRRLQRICGELRMEALINWVGDAGMDQLANEYMRADVFCLPSVQEGFGIVFLEAMAAGKPIVATRAAAVPEVVRHGLLVEPDQHEALAEAILQLHRDHDLRASLGEAGRRDVEQFEMHHIARRFLSEVAKIALRFETNANAAECSR